MYEVWFKSVQRWHLSLTTSHLGAEFVVPFSSRSQVVIKKSSNDNFVCSKLYHSKGAEFLVLFLSLSFSCSQVVIKKSSNEKNFGSKKDFEWKRHHLCELCHFVFDDFLMTTWEQENKSERKKEPKIPRLNQLQKPKY